MDGRVGRFWVDGRGVEVWASGRVLGGWMEGWKCARDVRVVRFQTLECVDDGWMVGWVEGWIGAW